jgi:amidase/aspartyl-tRNA(Asn)/glutamyl-tRNA(Gln) amidotransferase subunit A
MSGDELFTPAHELAERIAARELSPVEVLEGCIARIEERNPALNAFVFTAFDEAREAARTAERAVAAGAELGPLHGVPTAMKDLFDFKPGWPSTFGGVRAFKDLIVDFYCVWAERMEQAGAIIVGKTNSPVIGFRGTTDNPLFGPARNPFDESRNAGGSSGGSAAAVSDGLVPFAEGTDAGGSVRVPAAWCGLYGYKPSAGRVPVVMRPNAFGGTSPFVHEGLLTRNVADAVLGMRALVGYDPRDPFCLDEAPDYASELQGSVAGMRIGYSANLDFHPVDARIAATVERAVGAFEEAGAHVEPITLGLPGDHRELCDLWVRMGTRLNIEVLEGFKAQGVDLLADHRDDLPAVLAELLERGYDEPPLQPMHDANLRSEVFDAFQGALDRYDLVVSPTVGALPVPNASDGETQGPSEIEGVPVDPLIGWCLTYLINLTGHPAASIPAGLADGLPVGMQIIGRRRADGDVLRASAAFERLRPWQADYPALRASSPA